ncbi:sporulation histidine kinase inhibitor Sda [Neobacillus sp. MER 74]|uniref:sporulation histidine kinase inhibitor Sda n=1 Tax=Neobacillus sp. MER 74 TaxID=2939566 RepID=UPI00203D288E|nr:sporulation histidine kinase inhibitor Sda [Neobacillus sp. MER 74]MCM3113726.1 sporulation histidine kinase inhibitor Sda [Neobacillus sp. MER 74]HWL22707.1 sporulation histidine kinase inhibitor Sda [Ureibacillus sp.]
MHNLSTEQLLEAFDSAIKLNLCKDFVLLLANELDTRFNNESSPINDYRKILDQYINSD